MNRWKILRARILQNHHGLFRVDVNSVEATECTSEAGYMDSRVKFLNLFGPRDYTYWSVKENDSES